MESREEKPILVTQPELPLLEEFHEQLKDIWTTKWLTNNGKYHQALESELAAFLGVPYISLFSNGTMALITALLLKFILPFGDVGMLLCQASVAVATYFLFSLLFKLDAFTELKLISGSLLNKMNNGK